MCIKYQPNNQSCVDGNILLITELQHNETQNISRKTLFNISLVLKFMNNNLCPFEAQLYLHLPPAVTNCIFPTECMYEYMMIFRTAIISRHTFVM